jgi:microcompartment protein CcmL/EutN
MTQQAVGLIEAVGLPTAIEAADAALKAANVTLVGYEKTKGGGLIVVKIRGDVGAVNAAIEAAQISAGRVGQIYAVHVIPRPHENTEMLIAEVDRGAAAAPPPTPRGRPGTVGKTTASATADPAEVGPVQEKSEVCNLCGDPACPRRRGQPRQLCIHIEA